MSFVPSIQIDCFEVTHEGDPTGSCEPRAIGTGVVQLDGQRDPVWRLSSPITVRVAGNDPESVTITRAQHGYTNPLENKS